MTPKPSKAGWTTADAQKLYRIPKWGAGYYIVNEDGNIAVCPQGTKRRQIDLKVLVDELRERDIQPPVLIRFLDILSDRIKKIARCFQKAAHDYNYAGDYHPVYPIKVNQQRQVVEAMIKAGRKAKLGLEVGSKPELLTVLAMAPDYPSLIICNGYKDQEFIRLALSGQKTGHKVVLVAEKVSEIERVIKVADEFDVRPILGMRIKLSTEGEGRWATSAGDRSKFGLRISELVAGIDLLRERGLLDCFQLIHFHIGSQISQIDKVKVAMTEVARYYAELRAMDIDIRYVDVGGGLGVDYDGSSTSSPYSVNYSMQEYANDIVFALQQIVEQEKLPAPTIITESGRALTAHYSVLVTNIIDQAAPIGRPTTIAPDDPNPLPELKYIYDQLDVRNCREYFHDAIYLRRQAQVGFNLGTLSLTNRAKADELYWSIMTEIHEIAQRNQLDHQELAGLDTLLASTYFANFSLFQSLPDTWAIDQQFPIVPIQQLDERPELQVTLADITCDSDGHIESYITSSGQRPSLPMHDAQQSNEYYIGFFLVGAYQEILGDLHNLFGDTNAVHVNLDPSGGYKLEQYLQGDSVRDVLGYLQYNAPQLLERLRGKLETAVSKNEVSVTESARFLRLFEKGMNAYTYLSS